MKLKMRFEDYAKWNYIKYPCRIRSLIHWIKPPALGTEHNSLGYDVYHKTIMFDRSDLWPGLYQPQWLYQLSTSDSDCIIHCNLTAHWFNILIWRTQSEHSNKAFALKRQNPSFKHLFFIIFKKCLQNIIWTIYTTHVPWHKIFINKNIYLIPFHVFFLFFINIFIWINEFIKKVSIQYCKTRRLLKFVYLLLKLNPMCIKPTLTKIDILGFNELLIV